MRPPTIAFFFLTLFSIPVAAQEPVLGEIGESCRARADCKQGLACLKETCVDPNAPPPSADPPVTHVHDEGAGGEGSPAWMNFRLGGVHPFVGLSTMGGPVTLGVTGTGAGGFRTVDGGFLFALHAGVFIGKSQLLFEISPFTYVYDGTRRGPVFQMNGSYAYFIPLVDKGSVAIYWPLRVGIGMMAGGDNTLGLAYFQARADIVGLAVQIGHVMLDFHVPSFRYEASANRAAEGHILSWLSGVSASYVF